MLTIVHVPTGSNRKMSEMLRRLLGHRLPRFNIVHAADWFTRSSLPFTNGYSGYNPLRSFASPRYGPTLASSGCQVNSLGDSLFSFAFLGTSPEQFGGLIIFGHGMIHHRHHGHQICHQDSSSDSGPGLQLPPISTYGPCT